MKDSSTNLSNGDSITRFHTRIPLREALNRLSGATIDAAIRIHTKLGPGLLVDLSGLSRI
jgi:hypothetical protein